MSMAENAAWKEHLPAGWSELFQELLSAVSVLDPEVKITQAKEKFGELRVHVARADDAVYERIDAASRISRRTCQTCGGEALLCVKRGYFATLCEVHRAGFKVASRDPIVASVRISEAGVESVLRDSAQFGQQESGNEGPD